MMHVRDIMMHVGGYHDACGGCSVHRGFQYKSKAFIIFLYFDKLQKPQKGGGKSMRFLKALFKTNSDINVFRSRL